MNSTQIEWVTLQIPLLKTSDILLLGLKFGLLLANVGVYSYLFSEIFLYIFHKKLKVIYDTKLKYMHELCVDLIEKLTIAKVELTKRDEQGQDECNEEVIDENQEGEVNNNDSEQNHVHFEDDQQNLRDNANSPINFVENYVNEKMDDEEIELEKNYKQFLNKDTLQYLGNKIDQIKSMESVDFLKPSCSKSCLCNKEIEVKTNVRDVIENDSKTLNCFCEEKTCTWINDISHKN